LQEHMSLASMELKQIEALKSGVPASLARKETTRCLSTVHWACLYRGELPR
jgi:hypothetical protein